MSKLDITLNKKAVKDLLKSQEILDVCSSHAKKIQKRAGEGYETDTHVGKNRVNAAVYANTREAIRDCQENNTLLKSVRI